MNQIHILAKLKVHYIASTAVLFYYESTVCKLLFHYILLWSKNQKDCATKTLSDPGTTPNRSCIFANNKSIFLKANQWTRKTECEQETGKFFTIINSFDSELDFTVGGQEGKNGGGFVFVLKAS